MTAVDLIAVGADGRGGWIKVLGSMNPGSLVALNTLYLLINDTCSVTAPTFLLHLLSKLNFFHDMYLTYMTQLANESTIEVIVAVLLQLYYSMIV